MWPPRQQQLESFLKGRLEQEAGAIVEPVLIVDVAKELVRLHRWEVYTPTGPAAL